MEIQGNIINEITSTLGSSFKEPPYVFVSVRKNTRTRVEVSLVIIEETDRFIRYNLNGSLFEIGEHIYSILSGSNVLEQGILIVHDGAKETTPEYEGQLEGEKGEY